MDQNTKNPAGWPLDELQKGDFTYNVPPGKRTLTDFAKDLRENLDKEIRDESNFGNNTNKPIVN